MAPQRERVGLWMIGACGSVASTVALGVAALRSRRSTTTGLVTALPPFAGTELVDPGSIVIGGHEIRSESLVEAVQALHVRARLFDADLIKACASHLRSVQRNIRVGTICAASPTVRRLADQNRVMRDRKPAAAVERLAADMTEFRRRHRLHHVVVVNVASSEPPVAKSPAHARFDTLQKALLRPGSRVLSSSSLYALAAVEARCAFINFTPSPGICVPAIQERAKALSTPYMGKDGKTGESLVKSVLAPMFAMRNLSILSWVGQNILGNRDGAVLRDPKTRAAKIRSKDKIVSRIAGHQAATSVSIDYVPSLDDWKVAWDFVHFEGFLGTRMSLQFTWQGSDSILAAPLIIDLTRLAALECRAGRGGPMHHLACFFKDPIGVNQYDLFGQWQRLTRYMARLADRA